jgi:hypothetical protein
MGPAVHLAVACGTDADAGWDRGRAGEGNSTGFPISPVLANLFMHYAFDVWMDREFPGCPFERYADLCRVPGYADLAGGRSGQSGVLLLDVGIILRGHW